MTILDEPSIAHLDFEPKRVRPRTGCEIAVGGESPTAHLRRWFSPEPREVEGWREKVDVEMAKIIPAVDVLPELVEPGDLQTFWQSVDAQRHPFGYPAEVFPMSPSPEMVRDAIDALKVLRERVAVGMDMDMAALFVMCSPSRHQLLGSYNHTYIPLRPW